MNILFISFVTTFFTCTFGFAGAVKDTMIHAEHVRDIIYGILDKNLDGYDNPHPSSWDVFDKHLRTKPGILIVEGVPGFAATSLHTPEGVFNLTSKRNGLAKKTNQAILNHSQLKLQQILPAFLSLSSDRITYKSYGPFYLVAGIKDQFAVKSKVLERVKKPGFDAQIFLDRDLEIQRALKILKSLYETQR